MWSAQRLFLLALTVLWSCTLSEGMSSYSIRTVAGTGYSGYSGDSGPASSATLKGPFGLWDDTAGNLYFAEQGNNRVRKIAAVTGIITTFAGNGSWGFAGDGLQATDARVMLNGPLGVWMSSVNVLYIADSSNNRIRSVNTACIISTFAGGKGAATSLSQPQTMMGTTSGVIYITDTVGNRICAVDASGIMTVIAGNGGTTLTDNVSPTNSGLYNPRGIWILTNGDYYISESGNYRIRKVSNNIITTVVGGGAGFADNVQATASSLNGIRGVWVSDVDRSIYFAERYTSRIRAVDGVTGIISTIAGNGTSGKGIDHIEATLSTLIQPVAVYGQNAYSLYIVDFNANKVRLLTSSTPTSQPSGQPSRQPTQSPTSDPTLQPMSRPSSLPTMRPTCQPTAQPSVQPIRRPTSEPSARPTCYPTTQPTLHPTSQPTSQPTEQPIVSPTSQPSARPTCYPTTQPTLHPTSQPISQPTEQPTVSPTSQPSARPTCYPTTQPTLHSTCQPTSQPTEQPTVSPTSQPSARLTCYPTTQPTLHPTSQPISQPTEQPTVSPTSQPLAQPVSQPSSLPTRQSAGQSMFPTTQYPTSQPSTPRFAYPSVNPVCDLTIRPTRFPSFSFVPTDPSSNPNILLTVSVDDETCQPYRLLWSLSDELGAIDMMLLNVSCSSMVAYSRWRVWSMPSSSLTAEIPTNMTLGAERCSATATGCWTADHCVSAVRSWNVSDFWRASVATSKSRVLVMTRGQRVALQAMGTVPRCASGVLSKRYVWSVIGSEGESLAIRNSASQSALSLSEFALLANRNYTVQLTMSVVDGLGEAVAIAVTAVTLEVHSGALHAVVVGGLRKSMYAGQQVEVDASGSYDEDTLYLQNGLDNGNSSSSGATYLSSLSCVPQFNAVNATMDQEVNATLNVFRLSYLKYAVRAKSGLQKAMHVRCELSLQTALGRSTAVNVSLTVWPVSMPALAIVWSGSSSGKVNAADRLEVQGLLDVPAQFAGTATWSWERSLGGQSMEVVSVPSLTPLQLVIGSSPARRQQSFYLVLGSDALVSGMQYSLSLRCSGMSPQSSAVVSSTTSVFVTVNAGPRNGSLSVIPSGGVELSTQFLLQGVAWTDEDVPLSYAWGYVSSSGRLILLRSQSEFDWYRTALPAVWSAFSTQLPSVRNGNASLLRVQTRVYDALGASTTSSNEVTVSANASVNVASQAMRLLSQNGDSQDAEASKQSVALSVALLNRVICSAAPNCTLLHRAECSAVPNTCGSCESDAFVGVLGPSNMACEPLSASWSPDDVASCVNDCSGRGNCVRRRDSWRLSRLDVRYSCECERGFGGDDCSLTEAEIESLKAVRTVAASKLVSVCAMQGSMTAEENADVLVMALEVASRPLEVSVETGTLLLNVTSVSQSSKSSDTASDIYNQLLLSVLSRSDNMTADDAVFTQSVIRGMRSLVQLVGDAMTPSQFAKSQIMDTVSYSVLPVQWDGSETSLSLNVTVPQRSVEKMLGEPAASVQWKSDGALGEESGEGVLSVQCYPLAIWTQLNITMNDTPPVSALQSTWSQRMWTGGESVVQLPWSAESWDTADSIATSSNVVDMQCAQGVRENRIVHCDGADYAVTCNGSALVYRVHCPTQQLSLACVASAESEGSSQADRSLCSVTAATSNAIVCECAPAHRRRQLLSSSGSVSQNAFNATSTATVTVSYLAMLQTTATAFSSTVLSAQGLTASSVSRSWLVLAVMILLVVGTTAGVWVVHRWDSHSSHPVDIESADIARKESQTLWSQPAAQWTADSMLQASQLLPGDHQALSMSHLKTVFAQHHRWFGIVHRHIPQLPRWIRLLSLAGNIVVMLFVQSVTYALTTGDDGSCGAQQSRADCESLPSAYRTGEPQCVWETNADASAHRCVYVQPSSSATVSIFVSLLSALLSAPLAVCNEWMLAQILAAPTAEEVPQDTISVKKAQSLTAVLPISNAGLQTDKVRRVPEVEAKLQQEWPAFVSACRQHWAELRGEQRRLFEAAWLLNEAGTWAKEEQRWGGIFCKRAVNTIESRIRKDMRESIVAVCEECVHQDLSMSFESQSQRVLQWFQRDLLAGLSAQLLEAQDELEHVRQRARSRRVKVVCGVCLGVQWLGMLFYVFLFGVSQNVYRQRAWAQSFAVWLVLEIVLFSSVLALLYHVLLPLLLWSRSDVQLLRGTLTDVLQRMRSRQSSTEQAVDSVPSHFNAARYFFVSHRLASRWTHLSVSSLVLEYDTVWPRQSYGPMSQSMINSNQAQGWKSRLLNIVQSGDETDDGWYQEVLSLVAQVVMAFLSRVLLSPMQMQTLVVEWVITVVFGGVLLLHRWLYKVNPGLVVVPGLLLFLLGTLCCRSGAGPRAAGLSSTVESESRVVVSCPAEVVNTTAKAPTGMNRRQSLQHGLQLLQEAQRDVNL